MKVLIKPIFTIKTHDTDVFLTIPTQRLDQSELTTVTENEFVL